MNLVSAFYLPGMVPRDYILDESVELDVNVVSSSDIRSSFDFYDERFHFCKPQSIYSKSESLGSILFGDRLYNSDFKISMGADDSCHELCKVEVDVHDAAFINEKIRERYMLNWFIDGLPAAQTVTDADTGNTLMNLGFHLGTLIKEGEKEIPFLNNHYDITIQYHITSMKTYRIVGVRVDPYSVQTINKDNKCNYAGHKADFALNESSKNTVSYSYNVRWVEKNISWGTRWDTYLHQNDPKIHWFSIVNSIVIVVMLSGMIVMILLRALHKDITRYNSFVDDSDGGNEDFGWKLVHADVFRPPNHRMILSVLVGNGAQLICMSMVTLLFSLLGFLSPSSRGSLITVALVFYVCFSVVTGYVSARIYKMWQGEYWKMNVALSAFLVPGVIFIIFSISNTIFWATHSSSALPFGTFVVLILLWFVISIPLCILGAYFGFTQAAIESPCKINQIPRQIPTQPFYLNKWVVALVGGILPFGSIFIELYFIMGSIWFHRIYYIFGFLFLVFVILIITCSEVVVLMCYFHLCSEDYNWSWRAFMCSGSAGFYMFLYSILFYVRKMHNITEWEAIVSYFGWSLVMSVMFIIMTGSIGYAACLLFIHRIFRSIKID